MILHLLHGFLAFTLEDAYHGARNCLRIFKYMAFADTQSLYMAGSREHGVIGPTPITEAKRTTWIWKSV